MTNGLQKANFYFGTFTENRSIQALIRTLDAAGWFFLRVDC